MKARKREDRLGRILLTACVLLALGFALAWAYHTYSERQKPSVNFMSLKPVAMSRNDYSMAATVAIRTGAEDADWATRHRQGLEVALQKALFNVDPERALAPGGLRELQHALQQQLNLQLRTDKVLEVVITDFLVSDVDR